MSNDEADAWKRFLEDKKLATENHRSRRFEYEKVAIDYTISIFRTLTFLNTGGLVALPAAVSLFGVKVTDHHFLLIASGACFMFSIAIVCIAQAFAFFTFARRSDAEWHYEQEQFLRVGAKHFPTEARFSEVSAKIEAEQIKAADKFRSSTHYRRRSIWTLLVCAALFYGGVVFASLILFG